MKTIKSKVWYLEIQREWWMSRYLENSQQPDEKHQQEESSKPQEISKQEESSKQVDYQRPEYSSGTKAPDSLLPEGFSVVEFSKPDIKNYLELYRAVGSRYNWCDRLLMPKEELEQILQRNTTEICLLKYLEEPAGFVEFDKSTPGETEMVYFGLIEKFTGKKAGFPFLQWAINHVFEQGHKPEQGHALKQRHSPEQGYASKQVINRLWLHTCDLDHPAALPLYQKAGFVIYNTETVDQPVIEL